MLRDDGALNATPASSRQCWGYDTPIRRREGARCQYAKARPDCEPRSGDDVDVDGLRTKSMLHVPTTGVSMTR